jgi:PKD domain-containing protein
LLLPTILIFSDEVIIPSNAQTDNDAPVAIIEPFLYVNIGDGVEFNGSRSYDPGNEDNTSGGILEWKWLIRSIGENSENQSMLGNEKVFHHVFQSPGDYIINLTVTDMSGNFGWVDKIFVIGGPDLAVLSFTFSDPEINDLRNGDTPMISVRYGNSGTVEINSPWILSITDGSIDVIAGPILRSIAPGEVQYFNHTGYPLRAGDREFKVTLDVNDDIDEVIEENNNFTTKVIVQGGGNSLILDSEDSSPVLVLSILIILIILIIFAIIAVPIIIIVIFFVLRSKKKG